MKTSHFPFQHKYAVLNGQRYHYLHAIPSDGEIKQTVFLIHGWPDISFGWRHQIDYLVRQGIQCVAPDLLGFGSSSAPEDLTRYSQKRVADDILQLARLLGLNRIVLAGHDWGGAIVYRVALWHPDLVLGVMSVCTPYTAPSKKQYIPLRTLVETQIPNFGYQLQLASGEVEKHIATAQDMRQFLNCMFNGASDGEHAFTPRKGLNFAVLSRVSASPLLEADSCESYYVEEYMKNGIHSTLNWYRVREINHEEEMHLENDKITCPVLFIAALNDPVLTLAMSKNMDKEIQHLTRRSVPTSHWALWEAQDAVNTYFWEWLSTNGLLSSRANKL